MDQHSEIRELLASPTRARPQRVRPGSASQEAQAFLASWATTPDQPDQPATAQAPDEA